LTWFEGFGFVANPYQKIDPFKTSLDRLEWNRIDMSNEYSDLTSFVEDLKSSQKSGMRIIGAIGSGKTWFARMIEKYLVEAVADSMFIYTKVPRMEPTFAVVYSIAIQDLLDKFNRISEKVQTITGDLGEDSWLNVFEDEDLARGLSLINSGGKNGRLARSWLAGNRMTSSSLSSINIVNPLTSDYMRFNVLVNLYKTLSTVFSCAVLVIDELENAPIKLAGALSDGLRDMLSEFTERFGLVCLFTAESFDEWFEAGYTEALTRRIDYHVSIPEVSSEAFTELVRKHQTLYRIENFEVEDQAYPFTDAAILRIHDLAPTWRKYPGYLFPNCETLCRLAHEQQERISLPIGNDFVDGHASKLPYQPDSSGVPVF